MRQACLSKINKVRDVMVDVVDALEGIAEGVEKDIETRVEEALGMLPTPKKVADALETLGQLIEQRPWEDKRRKRA